MKFEKPKSKEVGTAVAQVVGATAGFMIPNGVANAYAEVDNEAVITDEQKTKKLTANAVCLVGGIALALMVKGDDMAANAVRGAGFGLAGGAVKGVIVHFAKDETEKLAGTTAGRFVAGALGCPCETKEPSYAQMAARLQRPRSLRMPMQSIEMMPRNNAVAFEL